MMLEKLERQACLVGNKMEECKHWIGSGHRTLPEIYSGHEKYYLINSRKIKTGNQ